MHVQWAIGELMCHSLISKHGFKLANDVVTKNNLPEILHMIKH